MHSLLSLSYQIGNRIKRNNTEIIENDSLINLKNINNEQNVEHTLQLDYSHPINDHLIEVGTKMIIRDQEMDYQTDSDSNAFVFPNEIFNYTQTVNAFYLSSSLQLANDYSLLLGTRYELTNIKGDWENGTNTPFDTTYHNILPNLTINPLF